MRIISGQKRGMTILSPKTDGTRPITDRIKESVFNVLQKYGSFDGAWAADVFSGTGSMGLEALSRGAEHVNFVEGDFRVVEVLNKNIEKGNFKNRSKVVRADAFKVGTASIEDRKFDFIFIDPPYVLSRDVTINSQFGKMISLLAGQVADSGVVIVRTESHIQLLPCYSDLCVVERRQWGTMAVTFLQLNADKQDEHAETISD